ncbi:MAG: hypothetical protein J7L64_06025 [Acidobacteria bacterium]|nr:hypothetical protein [Acidobacteriota bacterium]
MDRSFPSSAVSRARARFNIFLGRFKRRWASERIERKCRTGVPPSVGVVVIKTLPEGRGSLDNDAR